VKPHSKTPKETLGNLSRALGKLLLDKRITLSVAESCTGGMIGSSITSIAGSSEYFLGGIIAYSNIVKQKILKVPVEILDKHGAVSKQTVEAMAQGAAKLFKTDCAIAVSGIAGPGGGSAKKPVGLVFIGIYAEKKVGSFKYVFKGNRQEIRRQAVRAGMGKMIQILRGHRSEVMGEDKKNIYSLLQTT